MTVLGDLARSAHACVYAYGVIAAFLPDPDPALDAMAEHRRIRDAVAAECRRVGESVPPAAVAYPVEVRDAASARATAARLENAVCAQWASALDALEDGFAARHAAFAVAAAVRAFAFSGHVEAFPH